MDFGTLSEYLVLVVLVACLVVGYIIKHATFFKWIKNDNIPVILAFVGAIVNVLTNGLSVESVVYGALTGLASTGCHQAFTAYIDKNKKEV